MTTTAMHQAPTRVRTNREEPALKIVDQVDAPRTDALRRMLTVSEATDSIRDARDAAYERTFGFLFGEE